MGNTLRQSINVMRLTA